MCSCTVLMILLQRANTPPRSNYQMLCSVTLCTGGWSLVCDIDSKSRRKVSCGRNQASQRKLSFVQKLDKSHVRHRCYQVVHKKKQSNFWHIQSGVISSRQTPPFMSAICPRSYIIAHAMSLFSAARPRHQLAGGKLAYKPDTISTRTTCHAPPGSIMPPRRRERRVRALPRKAVGDALFGKTPLL